MATTSVTIVAAATAPVPAYAGDLWYDTNTNTLATFNGATGTWVYTEGLENLQDVQSQLAAASYAVTHPIFVAPNTTESWKVKAVSASFGTASTSGTLTVTVDTGTQAPGAGTAQLTGTISLAGAANTTVNGTIIAAPTTITAGNRVSLVFAGTVTNLLNAVISVVLQRVG